MEKRPSAEELYGDLSKMSAYSLQKCAEHEIRELNRLDTPGEVYPSKRAGLQELHRERLRCLNAELRLREGEGRAERG